MSKEFAAKIYAAFIHKKTKSGSIPPYKYSKKSFII